MDRVVIIAEAGVNHNGSIELAKQLVDAAAEAKVDYIKFQTWITEELIDKDAPLAEYQKKNDPDSISQYEMLKGLELSFSDFIELKKYCDLKNVRFLSTPDEEKSLDFLTSDLKLDLIKVGSGEVTNLLFLKKVARKKLDVILSTGMSTLAEVKLARSTLLENGSKSVTLLHCTSEYPAPMEDINLKAMLTLKNHFKGSVGYSDHTMGIEISLAAVAMGACIIEKHFTLDRSMKGPDHLASLEPAELKQMVRSIRNIELAMSGDGVKQPSEKEMKTKQVVQKGIYLSSPLKKGQTIQENDLVAKRPLKGLAANEYEKAIGKKINKDMAAGEPLYPSNFSND